MDTDQTPGSKASPAGAGAGKPGGRGTFDQSSRRLPPHVPGERYELRDPFAEVTYRSSSLTEMVERAEKLGSQRFSAIDGEGNRTAVRLVSGKWHRDAPQPGTIQQVQETRPAQPPSAARDARPRERQMEMPGLQPVPPPSARTEARSEQAAMAARLDAELEGRYVIRRAPAAVGPLMAGRTEYRFLGDTSRVAFTESTFKLATDTNSPQVARSMLDVAQARNWHALRVSGHQDFRRMVWLEAFARHIKAYGYEPTSEDLEQARHAREARFANRIEPARGSSNEAASSGGKDSGRGGGRKTVLAAIEAVLVAKQVPAAQRAAVMQAATEKLEMRSRKGQTPAVKVFDRSAPSRQASPAPQTELQLKPADPAPTRTR